MPSLRAPHSPSRLAAALAFASLLLGGCVAPAPSAARNAGDDGAAIGTADPTPGAPSPGAAGRPARDPEGAKGGIDPRPTPSDVALTTQVPGVRLTLLANAGFLLRSAEASVLVDAWVPEPHPGYDALPADTAASLLAARPPFDDVSMALASHGHRDHLQPAAARAFLAASPGTQLISTPEVIAAIEADAEANGDTVDVTRLQPLLPPPGRSFHVTRRGVTVELLNLPHGAGPPVAVQNLGCVITLGGLRIVHLGDAAVDGEALAAYAPAERGIDVALVPYWFFLDPDGRRSVEQLLPARMLIACHLPAAERAAVAETLSRTHPAVVVPEGPLASWSLDPAGP